MFKNLISALVFAALLSGGGSNLIAPLSAKDIEIDGKVNGVLLEAPSPVKPFDLKDQNNSPFTLNSLKGKWSLLFLGFTHCPDICPFTLSNLDAVRVELSQRLTPEKLPRIIFLAVDPERDEKLLKDYVKHFGLDFTGITGPRAEIDNLVKSLDGFYRLEKKHDKDDAYTVTHSAAIALINPAGEVVAKISPPMPPYNTANYLFGLISQTKTGL